MEKLLKIVSLALGFLCATCVAEAQDTIAINNAKLTRVEDSVQLTMSIDLRKSKIGKHEIVLVEPIMHTPTSSFLALPSVGLYGKTPYYYYIRSGDNWLQNRDDIMLRATKVKQIVNYAATMPYEAWMDTASVSITISSNHYCNGTTELTGFTAYTATPQVVRHKATTDVTTLSTHGQAHIDFIVNRTEINPAYHDNTRELDKIRQSIDSVRNDSANTLRQITIKGYASPEGPYQNNVRLAKGRSESLTSHIADNYDIPRTLMHADYQPEDWEGLRDSVEHSQLPHRTEILAIIDDTTLNHDLDAKLRLVKTRYASDYQYILRHYMPYLRHTDYTIDYDRRMARTRAAQSDTLWTLPQSDRLQPELPRLRPIRPILALKTNLLFDAAAALNFEVEVPFGKRRDWSIMVEDWFPWYLFRRNRLGDTNPNRHVGRKAYGAAYEVWTVGAELRRWFCRCPWDRPLMTGHFVGAYVASGKYDIEWKSTGDQGEFVSIGATWGYAWLLSKRLNLEFSASAGILWGPQRHYKGMFDDTRLIWQETRNITYFGPTKLKLSIVWLLGDQLKRKHRKEVSRE